MHALPKGLAPVLSAALFLLAASVPARAQAGFFAKELGSDLAQVVDDVKLDMMSRGSHGSESGSGPAPYLKALESPPRRVGLVSYYTVDIGNLKESSALTTAATGWYSMRSIRVTQEGISLINEALYEVGFPAMKEAFAAHGMQLLAPTEHLDTPGKKATDLIGSYAYLFGPNPVPDSGQMLYWTGHQYAGAWMKLDVPLIETDKDEAKVDFDGSAIVARALAERTALHVEDEMAGR